MQADIAVLTVIPEELKWALKTFGIRLNKDRRKVESGTIYWHGLVSSRISQREYKVVVTCIGYAGNYDCAAATSDVINEYGPKVVLLMGIAAGLRDKVKIGEVVLSERVVAYETAAIDTGEGGKEEIIPRGDMFRIEHTIEQDVANYLASLSLSRVDRKFRSRALEGTYPIPSEGKEEQYQNHVSTQAKIKTATIATGEKLLRHPGKLYALRRHTHGRTEVGEMEAAGLASACRRHRLPWLVVRGISDFGNSFKDDRFHEFAAKMAAVATRDFIAHGLDLKTRPPVEDRWKHRNVEVAEKTYFPQREKDHELMEIVRTQVQRADQFLASGMPGQALEIYSDILKKIERTGYKKLYPHVRYNEGRCYLDLAIAKNKKQNLNKAKFSLEKALEIYNIEKYPEEYADTLFVLGRVYRHSSEIKEKEKNLRKAVDAYEKALEVYNPKKTPYKYARTQYMIGAVYGELSELGNKKDNLDKAASRFNEALMVYCKEEYPLEYGRTRKDLGNVYFGLALINDRSDNLNKAFYEFKKARGVINAEKHPYDYAMIQIGLGSAHKASAEIENSHINLRKAVTCFKNALEIYTLKDYPYYYAKTQNCLGDTYTAFAVISSEKKKLLDKALSAHQEAKKEYSITKYPFEYAKTQNYIGNAYRSYSTVPSEVDEKVQNLYDAIHAHEQSLEILDIKSYRLDYAEANINLGKAYRLLSNIRDEQDNKSKAIGAFKKALKVVTPEEYPLMNKQILKDIELTEGK